MPAKSQNPGQREYVSPAHRHEHEPQPAAPRRKRQALAWCLLPAMLLLITAVGVAAGGLSFALARGRVLPGVVASGVSLSGLSSAQAAAALQAQWDEQTIVLNNGDLAWPVGPATLGMALDAEATAAAAMAKGRSFTNLRALAAERAAWFETPLVWHFDPATARQTLTELAPELAVAPVDAGIQISSARAVAVPAVAGRALDLEATLAALSADPAGVLRDGQLTLAVQSVPAAVTDVSAAVDEANRLLATTVTLEAYDPVRDERFSWPVEPAVWGEWLRLSVDPAGSFTWSLDRQIGVTYLDTLETEMGDGRYLDEDATLAALSETIQTQGARAVTQVRYPERRHTVQPGETLSSIGFDYGIPYPWIQQLNPSVESLSVGQEIAIPAADALLPLPVVPDKRIVVSLGEQRTRVYEDGQLKWDWPASTGIADSPTAPGVFQVQSHEPNAYAGNWDLWMPSFMGIYRPVPTSDFMNGFHGFPTRGNAQLLWTGDLGRRVTYGCILLSSENAAALYEWAEAGVVVEVRP